VHNRAALFEGDFIHQGFHEVNAATVLQQSAFWTCGVRYYIAVKPRSLVPDCNRDFPIGAASALYLNVVAGVLAVAVDHGVSESFTHGRLDIDFASIRRSKVHMNRMS
jgi:hypothetical protein